MNRLRHPNITILVGYLTKSSETWIVTRFHSYNGGSLSLGEAADSKCIEKDFSQYQNCLLQVCSAIQYLHDTAKVLHNDIKENNVVLELGSEHKPCAMLIDFGKARDIYSLKIYSIGADTTRYKHLAPELGFSGGKQSRSNDVFSFGQLVRSISLKMQEASLENIYFSCTRRDDKKRPTISDVCWSFKML